MYMFDCLLREYEVRLSASFKLAFESQLLKDMQLIRVHSLLKEPSLHLHRDVSLTSLLDVVESNGLIFLGWYRSLKGGPVEWGEVP